MYQYEGTLILFNIYIMNEGIYIISNYKCAHGYLDHTLYYNYLYYIYVLRRWPRQQFLKLLGCLPAAQPSCTYVLINFMLHC